VLPSEQRFKDMTLWQVYWICMNLERDAELISKKPKGGGKAPKELNFKADDAFFMNKIKEEQAKIHSLAQSTR
jgi:hypothetical protein